MKDKQKINPKENEVHNMKHVPQFAKIDRNDFPNAFIAQSFR